MSETVLHSYSETSKTKEVDAKSPVKSNLYQGVSIDNILKVLNEAYIQLDSYQKRNNYDVEHEYSEILSLIYDIGKEIDDLINFHRPEPDDTFKFNTFNKIWSGYNHDCFPGDISSDLTNLTRKFLLQIETDKLDFLERVSIILRSCPVNEPIISDLMKKLNIKESISDNFIKTKKIQRKFNCDILKDYIKGYILIIGNNKDVLTNELPSRLLQNTKTFNSETNMFI